MSCYHSWHWKRRITNFSQQSADHAPNLSWPHSWQTFSKRQSGREKHTANIYCSKHAGMRTQNTHIHTHTNLFTQWQSAEEGTTVLLHKHDRAITLQHSQIHRGRAKPTENILWLCDAHFKLPVLNYFVVIFVLLYFFFHGQLWMSGCTSTVKRQMIRYTTAKSNYLLSQLWLLSTWFRATLKLICYYCHLKQ